MENKCLICGKEILVLKHRETTRLVDGEYKTYHTDCLEKSTNRKGMN